MRQQLEQHIRNRDYRAALKISQRQYDIAPSDAENAAMHGHVLQKLDMNLEARAVLARAGASLPNLPSIWIDLANACIAIKDWNAADDAVTRFRRLAPNSGAGVFAEAEIRLGNGRRDLAEIGFRQATAMHPAFLSRRLRLAGQAMDEGDFDLADWHYQSCFVQHQSVPQVHLDFLASLYRQRKFPQAAEVARVACRQLPENAPLLQRCSIILDNVDCSPQERLEIRQRWVQQAPDSAAAHLALANTLASVNRRSDAHVHWQRAIELDPAHPLARWIRLHFPDQLAYRREQEMHEFERRWELELRHFLTTPIPSKEICLELIQSCDDCNLIYAGQDLLAPRRLRVAALSRFCDGVLDPFDFRSRASAPRARRRIGLISPSFGMGSASRVWRDLALSVERQSLELICFDLGNANDASVADWRSRADRYVEPQPGLLDWHNQLASADLDVLIFLDIGANAWMQALATRRYAPVQCTTWAFPLTSGSATIDYFLSSDAMEPEPALAQGHYSEQLVRLPGLACSYMPHFSAIDYAPASAPGSESAIVRYLCAQSFYKLSPRHDRLFARILAGMPESALHLCHGGDEPATQAIWDRLSPVLAARGIDPGRRLEIRPAMPFQQYLRELAAAHVMLDTMEFSGCLTSLDALSLDIPIVTLPGSTLRSRQTAAMLRILELQELVAQDEDDYVRIAIELGRQSTWRMDIRERIAQRKHRLYEFRDSTQALQRFLRDVPLPD